MEMEVRGSVGPTINHKHHRQYKNQEATCAKSQAGWRGSFLFTHLALICPAHNVPGSLFPRLTLLLSHGTLAHGVQLKVALAHSLP